MYRGRGRGRGNRPQIHENISVGRETVSGWSHQPVYPNTQNYHQTRSAEHELGIASRLGGVHQRQESHFVNQTPAQFDSSHMVQQFMQDPRLTAMYNSSQQSHIPIAMRIGDPNTNGIGRSLQTPNIYQNSAHFASSKVEQYMPDPRLTSRYSSSQQQSHIPVALRIGEPNTIGKGKSLLTSRTEGHFSGNNRDVVAGITRLPDGSTQNRLRMNEQRGGRTLRKLPIAIPVSPVFDRNNQEEFGNLDSFVHNLIDSFDLDQSSSAPSTEQREQPQRQTTELRDQSQPQSNELREKLQLQRTEPREQSQPQSIDPREQFQLQSIQLREQAQRQNIELISEQPELCQDEEQESFPSRFADFQRYFEVCEAVAVAPPSHSHLAKPIASSSSSGDKLIKESLPTARVRPELRGKQPLSNDLENSLKQTLEDIRQRQKITSPSPLAHSSNRNDESHNISEHSSRSNPPRAYGMEHNPFFYPPGPGEIIERNQRLTTGNMEPSNTRCNRSPFDDRQRPLDVPGSPEWHREVRILDDDDNGPDSRNWEPRRSPPGRSRSRSRSYSRSPQRLQRYFRSVSPPSYHHATRSRSRSRSRSRRSYHRSPHSFDRSPRHLSPRRFTSHPDSPPYRRYSRSRSRSRSRSVISPRSYHRSPHSFDRNLRHLSQSPRLSQRCIRPDSPPPRRRSRSRSRSSRRSYRRSPSFHRSLRHSPDNRFTHSRRSRNSPSPVRSRRSSPIRDRRSSPVRSRRSSPIRSRNRRSSPDYNYPNFLERRVIVQRNSPSPSRLRSPASRNTRHYVNGRRDFKSEQVGSDMSISPYSNVSPQFFTRDYIAAAVDSSEFANEPEPPPPGSERYDVPPLMQIPIMRRSPIPSDRGRCPNGSRFQREEYQNYSNYGSSESKRSFY